MNSSLSAYFDDIQRTILFLSIYQKNIESDLSENTKKRLEVKKAIVEKMDFDEIKRKQMLDMYDLTYNFYIPLSIHYSFITLLCIKVENQLNIFCKIIKEKENLPIPLKVIRGKDYIDNIRIFLSQNSIYNSLKYDYLKELFIVRNCIVHAFGTIGLTNDKDELEKIIKKENLPTENWYVGEGTLILNAHYCENAVWEVEKYFGDLLNIKKRLPIASPEGKTPL
jgi:hypothetical protein